MGRYFMEERGGERTLYYQPYEGEWILEEFFERPLFEETMGLVRMSKVPYFNGVAAAYRVGELRSLAQILQGGVAEEELLQILAAMAGTAQMLAEAGVPMERVLFRTDCIFAKDASKEVFYILHTGSFELNCPDFFTCIREILSMTQVNSVQYGVDKFIGNYMEEQKELSVTDFCQYLKNIRQQLFLTKQYSGQQSLSCRLGDSNIMIDELFSIEAPKFSTMRMMEQEAAKRRAYLVRVKTGEEIEITKAVFLIGKEEDADYRITDNQAISRKHASIIFREEEYFIKDLDSTNHTFVNHRLLKNPEEIKLEPGASLLLANEMFVYKEETI